MSDNQQRGSTGTVASRPRVRALIDHPVQAQKGVWTMRRKALWVIVPAFSFLAAVSPAFAGDPSGPEVAAVVSGNNQFAFDLYAKLAEQEQGNLFFSPYSVSTALAMTYAGARGNTEAQMAAALHFSLPQDDLHAAFGDVIGDLNGSQREGYQLNTANRLWGQQGYGFLPEFLDVTRLNYGAELARVDFIGATEPTRQTINHWVEEQTQQKIKNLIPSGVLTPLTRLVLTNAIYFKSDWKYQFDPELTEQAPFWTTPAEQVNVSMMHQVNDELKHAALPTFQILELPYTSEDVSMIALLPNERDGLAELEAWLTAETLRQSADQMVSKKVSVSIPKFGMTQKFGLSPVLSSLGMPDAFDPTAADFSGMNGEGDLYISSVVHKAFINLDEEGTEAAAATGVIVGTTSVDPPIPQFDADHPFVFFIRDSRTESILFMGRVADLNVGAVGVVPEPATLMLLSLGAVGLLRRKRRRVAVLAGVARLRGATA